MKGTDKKISMITAYDYTMAKIVDESGVNTILVGDSLGNTILGYEDTISVTVDDMIHHSAAVARGAKNALVITDMPFMSYQTSVYDAVVNAGRIMKEGRAGAVKLEGGQDMCPQISAIVKASIPVCAHLGLKIAIFEYSSLSDKYRRLINYGTVKKVIEILQIIYSIPDLGELVRMEFTEKLYYKWKKLYGRLKCQKISRIRCS